MRMLVNFAPREAPSGKMREPLVEMPKRKNEMPDAVKVAIVRAGAFYICSDVVLKVLGPRVQYMEFAEQCSDREREERTTYGGKHTKKVRGETLKRFAEMLEKAMDEEILDFLRKGYLKIPRDKWGSENVRRAAVKAILVAFGEDVGRITYKDFIENGLAGLIHRYGNSPYKALIDAGFDLKPWEMEKTPLGFWKDEKNRIAAIRWLVAKLGKDVKDITADDFDELGGLTDYYGDSPYEALVEAGFEFMPWEMKKTPMGFYEKKENRIAAIRWLVAKLGKEARETTQSDFYDNGLTGLLDHHNNSPFEALLDAALVTEADEEYMRSRAIRHMNEARQGKTPSPPFKGQI